MLWHLSSLIWVLDKQYPNCSQSERSNCIGHSLTGLCLSQIALPHTDSWRGDPDGSGSRIKPRLPREEDGRILNGCHIRTGHMWQWLRPKYDEVQPFESQRRSGYIYSSPTIPDGYRLNSWQSIQVGTLLTHTRRIQQSPEQWLRKWHLHYLGWKADTCKRGTPVTYRLLFPYSLQSRVEDTASCEATQFIYVCPRSHPRKATLLCKHSTLLYPAKHNRGHAFRVHGEKSRIAAGRRRIVCKEMRVLIQGVLCYARLTWLSNEADSDSDLDSAVLLTDWLTDCQSWIVIR